MSRKWIQVLALLGVAGAAMAQPQIPGYTAGSPELAKAPYTVEGLAPLRKALLFTEEDVQWLRRSKTILAPRVKELVGVWYGFVGSNPEFLRYFANPTSGEPDAKYLEAVRRRFEQWVLDTADANFDDKWLAYQYEIGLRHAREKKNQTDRATASKEVPFSYLVAFTIPITTTLKPFLKADGVSDEDVDKMYAAWQKATLYQAILWSYPYVKEGRF